MKARYMMVACFISLGLAALTSCSDAVYATVETATKTATNTLPLLLSIIDIAVTSTGSTYSVASGAIFEGSLSPSVGGIMGWTPNTTDSSRPYNPPGLQCFGAMAPFKGYLYGGFFDKSGNPSLYQSDASFSFATSSATKLTTAVPGAEQVTLLQATLAAGGTLFMGGAVYSTGLAKYQYQLDYSTDGTTWTATNLINQSYPIAGVGWDGANYWAASGTTIYTGATLSTFSVFTGIGTSNDTINGLFVDPANAGRIFITTKTRGIFYSMNSGASWINLNDSPSGSSSTYPAGFLCVAGPVDGNNGTIYLVGADGYGYYTLTTSNNTWTRFGDSTILLYSSSVRRIVVDNAPGQENVLMGTNLNGLWRGVFNNAPGVGTVLNGTNQYWIHE